MPKPKVSFYLDKPNADESQIFLRITNRGKRILIATGKKVPTKYWVKGSQRVKRTTAYPLNSQLNQFLNKLAGETERILLEAEINQQVLDKVTLRTEINKYLNKGKDFSDTNTDFFSILDNFIVAQERRKSTRTIQKYKTLKNQLLDFQKVKRYRISFEELNLQFYDKLEDYYYAHKKSLDSTWHKSLTTLHTFLNWATDRGYNKNLGYKKFKKPKLHDTDIIALTRTELNTLYNLDLSNNKKLSKIRDVFCFGCFTGLRFSDIEKLRKEDVKIKISGNEHLIVRTFKTKSKVNIPLCKEAVEIINRYIEIQDFLPTISNQKSNKYIKELGEFAGINEPTSVEKYSGGKRIEVKEPKFKFMTTHTGRRTFVTLALEDGARPEIVMEITDHKDYKTFKKYLKLTNKAVGNHMKEIWAKRDQQTTHMRIAN